MAEELDEAVNDIITQLKQNNKVAKAPIEESVLNKEDLEDLLEEVRTKIADQGRMVDDRLLSKEKMLEGCLIDLDKSNNQQEQ